MAGELEELKAILSVTDSAQYVENDILLQSALSYAISQINLRRGYAAQDGQLPYEPKYRFNVIQGAQDWLSRIGDCEMSSFSENGISGSYKDIPSWLVSVVPRLNYPK